MNVILPRSIQSELRQALMEAGSNEIGGILLGEHIGHNTFKIVELTIQRGGSFSRFIRKISQALKALQNYFDRTGYNYKYFNYLGEWHSHPSFQPNPSRQDIQSMIEIMDDEKMGANFAVLMIVKLSNKRIDGSVNFFTGNDEMITGKLILDSTEYE